MKQVSLYNKLKPIATNIIHYSHACGFTLLFYHSNTLRYGIRLYFWVVSVVNLSTVYDARPHCLGDWCNNLTIRPADRRDSWYRFV